MNIFRKDLEPSYFYKSVDDLIYPQVFGQAFKVFLLNPSNYSPSNGQITSQTQLDSEKVEFTSNLIVTASDFTDSNWTSNGWNLANLNDELLSFANSNLIYEDNGTAEDLNAIVVRKTIDSIAYTVIFIYVGNHNTSVGAFNYTNFASTTGLNLVSTSSITDNYIYLTDTSAGNVGNVWTTTTSKYNRSFELALNFECSGGSGADGFCVQWYTQNNVNGSTGGGVGYVSNSSVINAVLFLTWFGIGGSQVRWMKNNVQQVNQASSLSFRQSVYYWLTYNHSSQTLSVFYSTTNIKPASASHTFSSFSFDATEYYFGIGAATGGSTDNHILKSMSLSFI